MPYMSSLRILKGLSPSLLYPGHGPVIKNAAEHIQLYIHHREQREQEVSKTISNSLSHTHTHTHRF